MINTVKFSATVAAISLLAACSGGSTVLTPVSKTTAAKQYTQIERLSRPAIKEVFEPFQDHQKSNTVEPYGNNDPTIQADIVETEDALRPPKPSAGTDYGKTLASILYPDEYLVNLNGTAPAATAADPEFFLSAEVDGSSAFGGRAPNDDVIDLELPVLFGNTLSALKITADDGEENNCLTSQNIGTEDPSKLTGKTFPYLPSPH